MNEQLELATSMLAVVVAAVLSMSSFYLERVEMREARSARAALTLQADAGKDSTSNRSANAIRI